MEDNIQFNQSIIFFATKTFNFRSISKKQNLLIKSFMSRLKSFRIVFNFLYFQNIVYLTSEDKFRIILNLKNNFLFTNLANNFTLKRIGGFSSFSNSHTLLSKTYFCLWNLAILPFVETISNKFSFSYRPFRSSKNEFFTLKKIFIAKSNFFYLNIKVQFSITSQSRYWILNNFPNKNSFLRTWLLNLIFLPPKISNLRFDFSNLSYTFFNYLFSNLV